MQRQRVPSLIFCVGSAASLTSAVSSQTLDAENSQPISSHRGLGLGFGLMNEPCTSQAPNLPRRQSSRGMGFRKLSSSFNIDHQDSMKNATFQLGGKKEKNLLADRFGFLAPMLSPTLTLASRKTHTSGKSSDTPLTVPIRKASELSCLSPTSHKSIKVYTMLSGLKNANFDDLLNKSNHSSSYGSRNSLIRPTNRPLEARLFDTDHVRM